MSFWKGLKALELPARPVLPHPRAKLVREPDGRVPAPSEAMQLHGAVLVQVGWDNLRSNWGWCIHCVSECWPNWVCKIVRVGERPEYTLNLTRTLRVSITTMK